MDAWTESRARNVFGSPTRQALSSSVKVTASPARLYSVTFRTSSTYFTSSESTYQTFRVPGYGLTFFLFPAERITAVFGDYYIGGREFDRLETLISYYMYYSELVKGEKLIYPVAAPILCRLERICISVKPYPLGDKPSSDPDLSASSAIVDLNNSEDILYFNRTGQLFRVFHQVGEGDWLWAQSFDTNECGLLYSKSVEFIVSS